MEHDLRQCHSTWSFSFTELRRVDVFAEEVVPVGLHRRDAFTYRLSGHLYPSNFSEPYH